MAKRYGSKVSIPFKRESVFRVGPLIIAVAAITVFQFPSNGKVYSEEVRKLVAANGRTRFNSLQTGKCIQSSEL